MNKTTFYKTILLVAIFLASSVSSFSQIAPPVFKWADQVSTIGRKARSKCDNIKTNSKNEIFILSNFGTVTEGSHTPPIAAHTTFLGRDFYGAEYGKSGGNSANNNLLLTKIDKEGNIVWAVNSDRGEVYLTSSVMVPTNDGGVFLALKARHNDNNAYGHNSIIRIISSDNTKQELTFSATFSDGKYHRIYQPVFVKINKNGVVTMIKKGEVAYDAMPTAIANDGTYKYGTPDGFDFYGGGEDTEGNIYIGGRLRKKMTIDGNNEIIPHNTTGWDGDSQEVNGSLFVVKLDNNGNYISQLTSSQTDDLNLDNVKRLSVKDDEIYIIGNVKGKNGNPFNLGTFSFTPNEYQSAYAAKLNTDLEVQWLKYYPFVNTQPTKDWKLYGLTLHEDNFYIAGGVRGGIARDTDPTNAIIESGGTKVLNGFVLQCAQNDGTIKNAAIETSNSIGLSYSTICSPDSVYMYGYDTANSDVYLRAWGKKNLNQGARYSLGVAGWSTAWGAVAVDDEIIALALSRNTLTIPGTTTQFSSQAFSGKVLAWEFPGRKFNEEETGGATNTAMFNNASIKVYANGSQLVITGVQAGESVAVYNVSGQQIATAISTDVTTPLVVDVVNTGIYIVRTNNTVQKVIVR